MILKVNEFDRSANCIQTSKLKTTRKFRTLQIMYWVIHLDNCQLCFTDADKNKKRDVLHDKANVNRLVSVFYRIECVLNID
jgi:hypothetical protein